MQAEMKESDPNTTGEALNASNQYLPQFSAALFSERVFLIG
jgi:hypothetical protein